MDIEVNPIKKIKECINEKQNFVLQGGAGSGKTETLKHILEYISDKMPDKKIACITHTNLAVKEIISRVGNKYTICTIHSFLHHLIKNYKKNIHSVLFDLFKITKIEREDLSYYQDEKEQRKKEYKKYKKIYEKYARRLYTVTKESVGKAIGKVEYDKVFIAKNEELNTQIDYLNNKILEIINSKDYNKVRYNETRYDSFDNLTFGHDSLLKVSTFLFEKYKLLSRILQDKFDFIFIDEYQDTDEQIIDIFLNKMDSSNTTIGLFGDSMQGIYEDRIGNVDKYIKNGILIKIEKRDNFRSSEQVVSFISKLRNDDLNQEVVLKKKNGITESLDERQGIIKLYYSIYPEKKPHSKSPNEEKEKYINFVLSILKTVEIENSDYKKLMLTNKAISKEVGFQNLYGIFNERFSDVKDEIEKELKRLQLLDLAELCLAYDSDVSNYNFIITEIKKAGFILKSVKDKIKIKEIFEKLMDSNRSAIEVLHLAFDNNLIKKSESFSAYENRKNEFLNELEKDDCYQRFKSYYCGGMNTFSKISDKMPLLEEVEFNEFKKLFVKENYFKKLFSEKLKFIEILNYYRYLNEETQYITMHKTKGSGIENVLIVLDEFFWTQYSFKLLFDESADSEKRLKNRKLFYVACSRAIKNLIIIKVVANDDEEALLIKQFSDVNKV